MKMSLFAAPAATFILAGCSGGSENLQAGQWERTLEVTEATASDMPEDMQAQLRDELNRELAMDPVCISAEEAAAPSASLFVPSEAESECDFSDSTIAGGAIAISGICGEAGDGGNLDIEGNYTATTAEATLEAHIQDGNDALDFTATLTAERTGDCDA